MKLKLRAHMMALEAEELLNSGRAASMSAKAIKELVLIATGDEKQANDTFSRLREQQLAAGGK